jgi:type IV pilus assembly protein PilX
MKRDFPSRRLGGSVPACRQQGLALFMVLVFLTILTMLALTAIQGAALGERMARNQSDRTLAMQAAEAALRDAELDLRTLRADGSICRPGSVGCRSIEDYAPWENGYAFQPTCPSGLCDGAVTQALPTKIWEPGSALWRNAVTYGTYTKPAGQATRTFPAVARQPQYLIEKFLMQDGAEIGTSAFYFRITARGYGGSSDTAVTLQSIYRPSPPL